MRRRRLRLRVDFPRGASGCEAREPEAADHPDV